MRIQYSVNAVSYFVTFVQVKAGTHHLYPDVVLLTQHNAYGLVI